MEVTTSVQGASILADLGTEQVELIALSQRTGVPKYKEKVIVRAPCCLGEFLNIYDSHCA